MTDEEIRKMMEFLITQQVRADERFTQGEQRMTKIEDVVLRLANVTEQRLSDLDEKVSILIDAQIKTTDKLSAFIEHTDERLSALADAQEHTDERLSVLADAQAHTDERLSALADAQAHTDGRLNVLIDIISERRNGSQ